MQPKRKITTLFNYTQKAYSDRTIQATETSKLEQNQV